MTLVKPLACALALSLTHATVGAHEICTAVADARTGEVLVQRGDCAQRVTPASTFKIAISLMGYDAGFLKDEHQPTLPFRYYDRHPQHERPERFDGEPF